MKEFLVFKTFPDLASAEEVASLLKGKGITVEVLEEARLLDNNYMGQQFSNPFLLYLRGKDFDHATLVLESEITVNLQDVDPDYMLLSFNEEELIEVMEKKDEWGIYNYKLAEALLKERNAPIPEIRIALEQAERLRDKEKPVASGIMFLVLGYSSVLGSLVSLFIPSQNMFATLGQGLFGLFIGWNLSHFKRTLSNGQRTFYFNDATRLHGVVMFWAGLAITVLKIILLSAALS